MLEEEEEDYSQGGRAFMGLRHACVTTGKEGTPCHDLCCVCRTCKYMQMVDRWPDPLQGVDLVRWDMSALYALPIVVFGFNCHANVSSAIAISCTHATITPCLHALTVQCLPACPPLCCNMPASSRCVMCVCVLLHTGCVNLQ